MPAHFVDAIPVLTVEAVEPSRAFFCDRLGFTVVTEVEHAGALGFSMLARNDVTIMVQSRANLEAGGESRAAGQASIYVIVDQVEALVPEVADADVVLPLRKSDYGMHEIGIREPGGNVIVFASRLTD